MLSNHKISYLLIASYMGIIALGSLTPLPFKTETIPGGDKVIHFLLYLPLGFFFGLLKFSSSFSINFLMVLILGALYGGIMEFLQHFVPGRTVSLYDEIANVLGVGSGYGLELLREWITRRKRRG